MTLPIFKLQDVSGLTTDTDINPINHETETLDYVENIQTTTKPPSEHDQTTQKPPSEHDQSDEENKQFDIADDDLRYFEIEIEIPQSKRK